MLSLTKPVQPSVLPCQNGVFSVLFEVMAAYGRPGLSGAALSSLSLSRERERVLRRGVPGSSLLESLYRDREERERLYRFPIKNLYYTVRSRIGGATEREQSNTTLLYGTQTLVAQYYYTAVRTRRDEDDEPPDPECCDRCCVY
jgi:hypothetical protein